MTTSKTTTRDHATTALTLRKDAPALAVLHLATTHALRAAARKKSLPIYSDIAATLDALRDSGTPLAPALRSRILAYAPEFLTRAAARVEYTRREVERITTEQENRAHAAARAVLADELAAEEQLRAALHSIDLLNPHASNARAEIAAELSEITAHYAHEYGKRINSPRAQRVRAAAQEEHAAAVKADAAARREYLRDYHTDTDAAALRYLLHIAATGANLDELTEIARALSDSANVNKFRCTNLNVHRYAVTVYGTGERQYMNLSYTAQVNATDPSRIPAAVIRAGMKAAKTYRAMYLPADSDPLRITAIYAPNSEDDYMITAKDITRRTLNAIIKRLEGRAELYEDHAAKDERRRRREERRGTAYTHRADGTHADSRYNYLRSLYMSLASVRDNGNGLFIDTDAEQDPTAPDYIKYADARDLVNAAALAVYQARNMTARTCYRAAARAVNDIIDANRRQIDILAICDGEQLRAAAVGAKLTRDITTLQACERITAKQAYAIQRRIDGATTEEIAQEMDLTRRTVREHQDRAALNIIRAYISAGHAHGVEPREMERAAQVLTDRLSK